MTSSPPDSNWDVESDDFEDDEPPEERERVTLPYPWMPHEPAEPSRGAPPAEAVSPSDQGAAPPSSTMSPSSVSSVAESVQVLSSGGLHTVRTAAAHMGVSPRTLRRQCRNGAGHGGVADLGGGIYAFKIGKFWHIRFPWQ